MSRRRRQVMVAALAGVAAPAVLAARAGEQLAGTYTEAVESRMIVSGRILGPDQKALAGATIDVWDPEGNGDRVTVATDGDGRFFAAIAPARRSGHVRRLDYRISHQTLGKLPARRLALTREGGRASDRLAHLHRDETGMWRASFGIALA
jgi:protocatechuate 3,4-dioxygenase beta subunit